MSRTETYAAGAGFTLLELMIAVALTGLLCLVTYTSLSLSLKARQRGQAAAMDLQEVRVGQSIMERSLSSAVGSSLSDLLYFVGDAREMQFFTPVPLEAHNLGGIYHWRVLSGRNESGQGVLAVEQTKNVNWDRDPKGVEVRQIIMGNLAFLRFSYGRGAEEYQTWDAKSAGRLPDWVKISLAQTGHEAVVLLIPIYESKSKSEIKSP
jgi:prepilin-type N-terminal cleavage/methylation domain-containing protein